MEVRIGSDVSRVGFHRAVALLSSTPLAHHAIARTDCPLMARKPLTTSGFSGRFYDI